MTTTTRPVPPASEPAERPPYPVHVDAQLEPSLSRWLWLVKWVLAIPHYVVLAFLWVAFVVVSVLAFFGILLTGRYPRGLFDFNVGVLRWSWRVGYYTYGALGTDRYPPFTLAEVPDYPAHLTVDYPDHLSRGLVLVKWWLLAIPHYLVLGFFLGGAWYAASESAGDADAGGGAGLIGLLVLIAAVVLLFTGRYPQPVFDLVLGMNRWALRVAAYAGLMTDHYPPFRLDQGGPDPDATSGRIAVRAAPPPPVGTVDHWGAGRIVTLVVGSIFVFLALGAGAAATGLAVVSTQRDADGYLMSSTERFVSDGYALTSEAMVLQGDAPSGFSPERLLGDAKVEVRAVGDAPVFVGVADSDAVDALLAGVATSRVTDFDGPGLDPVYRSLPGGAPTTLPTDSDIWVAQSVGTGTQQVEWPLEEGDWTVVVMNADGSRVIDVDAAAGATLPILGGLTVGAIVATGLTALVAIVLLLAALLPRRQESPLA